MIVCHCNVISADEIRKAARGLLREDPWRYVTPISVYQELGKRGKCFGCFSAVVETIISEVIAERKLDNLKDEIVEQTIAHLKTLETERQERRREQSQRRMQRTGRGADRRAKLGAPA